MWNNCLLPACTQIMLYEFCNHVLHQLHAAISSGMTRCFTEELDRQLTRCLADIADDPDLFNIISADKAENVERRRREINALQAALSKLRELK